MDRTHFLGNDSSLQQSSFFTSYRHAIEETGQGCRCKELGWGYIASATVLVTNELEVFGSLGDAGLEARVIERCGEFLRSGEKSKSIEITEYGTTLFLDLYHPDDRLFIFGGAEGPEEIAVSIVAELIKKRRGRDVKK